MTSYIVFDTDESFNAYLRANFEYINMLDHTNENYQLFEVSFISENKNCHFILKVLENLNQRIFDESLQYYIHREYFILKIIQSYNMSPKVLMCLESPSKTCLLMAKSSADWKYGSQLLTAMKEEKVIRDAAKSIIKGMIALNNKGIYHMNIKPNNILINIKTCKVKFIDFGDAIYKHNTPVALKTESDGTIDYTRAVSEYFLNLERTQVFNVGCFIFSFLEKNLIYVDEKEAWRIIFPKPWLKSTNVEIVIKDCLTTNKNVRPTLYDLYKMDWFRVINWKRLIKF